MWRAVDQLYDQRLMARTAAQQAARAQQTSADPVDWLVWTDGATGATAAPHRGKCERKLFLSPTCNSTPKIKRPQAIAYFL